MKRLIKLLSIFGVLIILGSCSSSKSVNVSELYTDSGYLIVTFVQESTGLDGYTYKLKQDVEVRDNDTGETIEKGYGTQIDDFFVVGHSYTFYWYYTSNNPSSLSGESQITRTLNAGDKNRRISFYKNTVSVSSN